MRVDARVHGGPDGGAAVAFDFSTNANAAGPCPQALEAVRAADATRYPDPVHAAVREAVAALHGVAADRIVPAASGSEFIFRVTAWAARQGVRQVALPAHAFGDYAAAASAWGLRPARPDDAPRLAWLCEPSSPLGQACEVPAGLLQAAQAGQAIVALDLAYEPLRLDGGTAFEAALRDAAWQLWTPNKALGLTGVRGAYAIAPAGAQQAVRELDALAPSWPLGAHAVAMLQAWATPAVQDWVAGSRRILAGWKQRQLALCADLGWHCLPSLANFFCADALPLPLGEGRGGGWRDSASGPVTHLDAGLPQAMPAIHPGAQMLQAMLPHLRTRGLRLRDCASFGLPGHVRLGVLPPAAQDALARAWKDKSR